MNKDVLLGIGIGLLAAAVLMTIMPAPRQSFTDLQIIQAARDLGMIFPAELPVK